MARKPLFEGLIVDEYDQPVKVAYVGNEPCYVVNDAGFLRHIPSEVVDRQVLQQMRAAIAGHEDFISEQTAKMLGQDDIFSRAMIETQLKQIESQFEALMEIGLPDEVRAYMGLMGFRIVIDVHGNVIEVQQPSGIDEDEQ